MAQGQAYKQTLLNNLGRVRDLIDNVDQEAAVSLQYRVRDLEKLSQEYFPTITRLLLELKEQQNNQNFGLDEAITRDLSTRIGEAAAGYAINSFYSHLSSNPGIDGRIQGQRTKLYNQYAPLTHSKGVLPLQILEARPSAEPDNKGECEHSQEPFKVPSLIFKATITQDSLFSALRIARGISQQDLKRCLGIASSLSLVDQDRVEWMMQSPKLREWLDGPKSRALLLNGNGDTNEMFSPTTFLSAKLLESLSHIEPIFLQHFFCSLHTSSREDNDNATGLIKSFVSQLLLRDDICWDLTFLSTTDVERIQQSNDLEAICALFRKLIRQLPTPTFLFWMIDGINYYERSERRRDFLKVIHELLSIIKDSNGVVIKLLLTCPGKSLYVRDALGKEDILTVPPTVDGSRQGWSERAYQKTVGKEIGNMDAGGSRS